YGGSSGYPYYLADMDRNGTADLIIRVGNILYVNTDGDIYTDWWFTYGASNGSDDYYFADIDGDAADDVLVRRTNVVDNWFLVLYNSSIQTSGAANYNDTDFTYGWGL
ncbi:MAG TPA: hypothetical protein DEG44_00070, partial [Candidatus Kerfeldbacteria bacterium]|nr:hypothetical protein [Candidatus Kerfeldbacteria bacterium]